MLVLVFLPITRMAEEPECELSGLNFDQGKRNLVRVSGEFELSEFESAGLYCSFFFYICETVYSKFKIWKDANWQKCSQLFSQESMRLKLKTAFLSKREQASRA